MVPLDIFPSSVISSSLVQKSYSVNYPGEFGGGVINLTTRAVPRDGFISFGTGISGDTETTGQRATSIMAARATGPALTTASAYAACPRLVPRQRRADQLGQSRYPEDRLAADKRTQCRAAKLEAPAGELHSQPSAGKSFDVGSSTLGVIFAAGYSNKWSTRDARQQSSLSSDLSTLKSNFQRVTTDNRIVVNGLLGLGLEFGSNKIRWTNLYIRDTIKQSRLGLGNRQATDHPVHAAGYGLVRTPADQHAIGRRIRTGHGHENRCACGLCQFAA